MDQLRLCQRCHAELEPDAAFCLKCGLPVIQTGVSASAAGEPNGTVRGGGYLRSVLIVLVLLACGPLLYELSQNGGLPVSVAGVHSNGRVSVTYKLTGNARGANLTYIDGSGNIQQQTGVAVPLKNGAGAPGISFMAGHGAFVSFSAQNNYSTGNLHCSIEADGVEINSGDSNGGYAIVSCTATLP